MAFILFVAAAVQAASARPNIILLLADDLGYGDLSCQNPASKINTPNLDRLASQGLRFTDAHAPSALCTPSRYALLTGQFCWRTRLKSGVLNMWDEPLIAPERLTVAGMLQNQGYRTACFGKWHLGFSWPFVRTVPEGFDLTVKVNDVDWSTPIQGGPVAHGFDYYFGINIPNEPPYAYLENNRVVGIPDTQYATVSGQQGHWAGPGIAGWDWRQVLPTITDRAIQWLQESLASQQPFFLYCPFTAPHQPVLPSAEFQGSSRAGDYGDFVQELDWEAGRILNLLATNAAATNTLVIFASDNGPDEYAYPRLQEYGHASTGALRGIKSDLWEGGHRIPFLASWPGKIAAGATSDHTICLVDFMRTVADVAGVPVPTNAAEDSVSFLPALLAQTNAPKRSGLVLESGCGQFGIRSNGWMYIDAGTGDGHNPELEPLWFKLMRGYPTTNTSPACLYDLVCDLAEGTNLYSRQPDWISKLDLALEQQHLTATWLGAQSGLWTNCGNWAPPRSPAGADVSFTNGSPGSSYCPVLGADFCVNSIGLPSGLMSNITVSAGGPYQLSVQGGIDLSDADANLALNIDLVVAQSQIWNVRSNHTLTVNGAVELNGTQLTIGGGGNANIAGPLSGNGGLVHRGSGFFCLKGTNTFRGGIEISGGGFLSAENGYATGYGAISVPNQSTLWLRPGVTITNAAGFVGFGSVFGGIQHGAITLYESGEANYRGPVTLAGNTGVRANRSDSVLTFTGPISGIGPLTIMAGTGTVAIAAANLYSGQTIVEGQLMLEGGDNRLPAVTELSLATNATAKLMLNGCRQTVAVLSGGGTNGGNISLAGGTLTVNQTTNSIFAGVISGTGTVVKANSGALTLTGNNIYSGSTIVESGILAVEGSLGCGSVEVLGGTLTGSGTMAGTVKVAKGGTLETHCVGTLTIGGMLALEAGSVVRIAIDPLHNSAGSVRVANQISFGGTLQVVVPAGAALTNGQSFQVFSSGSAAGVFEQIGPDPGSGLGWVFIPHTGTLKVAVRPLLQFARSGPREFQLSWNGSGFHVQAQTNAWGSGLTGQWFDFPAGTASPVRVPILNSNGSVFLRLVGP